MIRSATCKAVLLTATVLLSSTAFVNCTNTKNTSNAVTDTGSVGLAVKLSTGITVDKVNYSITGNGITPVTGTILTTDPGATISVLVNGLPAGMGYTVTLTATASDGVTTCGGSTTFAVVANQTSSVTVALQCMTPKTTGSVGVTGTLNNCPALTSFTAAPLAVATNGIITIGATASDLDAGDTLTFAWTATGGSFAAATSAATTYDCSTAGAQTLTITVSDGHCTDSATIPVTCVALSCGNGKLDPGEQCDPPSVANHCDANCQTIPVCGNSVVEKGEQCDPPNGTTCDASCRTIVCGNGLVQPGEQCEPPNTATCDAACHRIVHCGDGFVDAGEQCDPPNGTTCDATCHSQVAPFCGDGIVNQASEQCDPPNTMTCDANCKTIDLCAKCEAVQCDPAIAGCGSLTGTDQAACLALVACIRSTSCSKAGDAQPCYCGTASDIACLSGSANGACKAQVEAAAKSTDAGTIANEFVDPTFPVGLATNLIGCDATSSCAPPVCKL